MLDLRKRLIITMIDEGNDYIRGKISGIIGGCQMCKKDNYSTGLDTIANRLYFTAYVFPWEYRKIKKAIELNYPEKCKFYYN